MVTSMDLLADYARVIKEFATNKTAWVNFDKEKQGVILNYKFGKDTTSISAVFLGLNLVFYSYFPIRENANFDFLSKLNERKITIPEGTMPIFKEMYQNIISKKEISLNKSSNNNNMDIIIKYPGALQPIEETFSKIQDKSLEEIITLAKIGDSFKIMGYNLAYPVYGEYRRE